MPRYWIELLVTMLVTEIDWAICQACEPCEARLVCKTRAIVKIDVDEPPYIELSRCTNCGLCVLACVSGAISMKNNHSTGGQRANANI